MELMEKEDHFLELKDDGTYVRHFIKLKQFRGFIFRIDINPSTRVETPSISKKNRVIEIAKATGLIKTTQYGFNLEIEILGVPTHLDPKMEYIRVDEDQFPPDYYQTISVDDVTVDADGNEVVVGKRDVGRTAYDWDRASGTLKTIPPTRLNAPEKRTLPK